MCRAQGECPTKEGQPWVGDLTSIGVPPRGTTCAEPRASARRRRASPGLATSPPLEPRSAGRHDSRRSALLRIPARLNLCVSVDNGVNSTWHLPLTTVFQQLTAVSPQRDCLLNRPQRIDQLSALEGAPKGSIINTLCPWCLSGNPFGIRFLSMAVLSYNLPLETQNQQGFSAI